MKIGILLLTHNESLHILPCLQSIGDREVVIIDSGSSDDTLEKIRRSGSSVEVVQRPFVSFSGQRNYALDNCFTPGQWVLHLDADERLTQLLLKEIDLLDEDSASPAYNIASMTFFRGKPIPRAGGYPLYQTRLTRVGDFRFIEVGHGQKAPLDMKEIPNLKNWYEHHSFDKGMSDWIQRHDRYSTKEAEEWLKESTHYRFRDAVSDPIARRQWLKQVTRSLPMAPTLINLYLLLGRGAIFEGQEGRDACRMRMIYEHMIILKLNDLKRKATGV